LPLAIEFAAPRVQMLGIEGLAADLNDNFRLRGEAARGAASNRRNAAPDHGTARPRSVACRTFGDRSVIGASCPCNWKNRGQFRNTETHARIKNSDDWMGGFPVEAWVALANVTNHPVHTLIACRDFSAPNKIGDVQDFREIQIRDETKNLTRTCRDRGNRPRGSAET
jgi:hypothetical protein